MSFLKNIFKKEKPQEEPFTPSPTQHVPGLEPIIVQAVENIFPRAEDQKEIFNLLAENRKNTTVLIILSLLSITSDDLDYLDDLESAKTWLGDNTSTPLDPANISKHGTFYHLAVDSGFHTMKDAEKWVKSISKSKV